jgi:hypothetical protein|tara:strand:+ start:6623 stop:6754 length:132 start_codon:yes stop_codon:yes gene_type:complete
MVRGRYRLEEYSGDDVVGNVEAVMRVKYERAMDVYVARGMATV